jgi:hypothetical protein
MAPKRLQVERYTPASASDLLMETLLCTIKMTANGDVQVGKRRLRGSRAGSSFGPRALGFDRAAFLIPNAFQGKMAGKQTGGGRA